MQQTSADTVTYFVINLVKTLVQEFISYLVQEVKCNSDFSCIKFCMFFSEVFPIVQVCKKFPSIHII